MVYQIMMGTEAQIPLARLQPRVLAPAQSQVLVLREMLIAIMITTVMTTTAIVIRGKEVIKLVFKGESTSLLTISRKVIIN